MYPILTKDISKPKYSAIPAQTPAIILSSERVNFFSFLIYLFYHRKNNCFFTPKSYTIYKKNN